MVAPEESPRTPVRVLGSLAETNTIVLVISDPIEPARIPELCECVSAVLEGVEADVVACNVNGLVDPDAGTVDALARMELTARRLGRRVQLIDACDELKELVGLMGLADVIPVSPDSPFESKRQVQQGEEPRGVEKEADPADPVL